MGEPALVAPEEGPLYRDLEWLQDALHALDRVFFDGHLGDHPVKLRWMRWRPTKGFVYAQYWDCQGLIEVNRALAWLWVPDYVVMATLYHEALHHVVGMDHDLAFNLSEARYPHFAASQVWEARNINSLLGAKRPF